MKILFCTDGSDISMTSLDNISTFVKEAVFDVICVIDWSFLPESMNIEQDSYSKTYEHIADGVLDFAEKTIIERGFAVGEKIKSFGSAVEGILEQQENVDYDLVLLGSHGKKGLQKWLGSVSRQVVSNAKEPVFVSKRKTAGKKILLTTDGSEHAYAAVKKAISLFDFSDKDIYIASVKENPELLPLEAAFDKNWLENIEKQQKIHAAKAINKLKALLEKSEINVHLETILTGSPAQKIIEYVDKEQIDLVIMGARSKSDLSALLLGSVSKRVLENVHCCVSIIKK